MFDFCSIVSRETIFFWFSLAKGYVVWFFWRKVLMLAYTIAIAYRCIIILAGLRPSNPPHTRGEPLVNPPKGLCGAGDSAVKVQNNLSDSLSRDKGHSGLYFSPYYRVKCLRRENPTPQKWAKVEVIKSFNAG